MSVLNLIRRRLFSVGAVLAFCLAPTQSWADQTDAELNDLFAKLAATSDAQEVKKLESQIEGIWRDPKSPSINFIMRRATEAMDKDDFDGALAHLDDVTELAPSYAEGWNRRAMVHFFREEYDEAILAIERTVRLEPRHYGAWSGLGRIFLDIQNEKGALEAYRRALSAHPNLDSAKEAVRRLESEVEGRGI